MKTGRIQPTPAHSRPLKNISVSRTIRVRTRFEPSGLDGAQDARDGGRVARPPA